ncbi:MAG TPA: AsmA-like C-terminal region-containing protein [Hyphomicrobiaceae bacterium]|jgi:AsmA protein|nr:AsmA-like C-terminal region-containing protein [Hyphomicrobiaceae bacterium]
MRRTSVISRLKTLVLATLACLLLALVAPLFIASRAVDEPFSGYSVLASPRDLHVITKPARLSLAPDLTLSRGVLYADGNAALGTPISRFVLDGPVFYLNASGLAAAAPGFDSEVIGSEGAIAPLLDQFMSMGFDALTIRRGTLYIMTADGAAETVADIQAEVSGGRKGQVNSKGSFLLRGQRLTFDASVVPPAEKQAGQHWLGRLALKGALIDATFDGTIDVVGDLKLAGHAELMTSSLRKCVRWFGLPVPASEGLNAVSLKGQLNWARGTVAVEKAKVTVDGSEATGTVAFAYGGEHPAIDGTLAFNTLELAPYFEALRSQSYVFDRHTWSWSAFDFSFPILGYFDADLRLSAASLGFKGNAVGRGAASIAVRSGKLIANIVELELPTGTASGRMTADVKEFPPRYALRGKIENFEPGPATAMLTGLPLLSGRSLLKVELKTAGQTPAEVLRGLSGKVAISMAEGGKLGLDVRAIRTGAEPVASASQLVKSATSVDTLEARANLFDGLLVAEHVQARAGGLAFSANGSANLLDHTLDLRLSVEATDKSGPSPEGNAQLSISGPWGEPALRREPAAEPVAR